MTQFRSLWDQLDHVARQLERLSQDYARGAEVREQLSRLEWQLAEVAEDVQLGFIERRRSRRKSVAPRRPRAADGARVVAPRFGRPAREPAVAAALAADEARQGESVSPARSAIYAARH